MYISVYTPEFSLEVYIHLHNVNVVNDVGNPCGQCKVPGNDYSIIENPDLIGGLGPLPPPPSGIPDYESRIFCNNINAI